jgi:hypothetical protein
MDGRIIPPSNTRAHQGNRCRIVAFDLVLHLVDVVVEAQVLGAEDGKRTDDAVVTTMVPAGVMMSFHRRRRPDRIRRQCSAVVSERLVS